MTTAAAQIHQFALVHSISLNTSASNGYPSTTVSSNPFRRSRIQVFIVVVLKPNRSSSLNCAYQANGNPGMLNAMPVTKRKPAMANVEVPKLALSLPNAHGNTPLKSTAMSTTSSNTSAISPKQLLASVYSTERRYMASSMIPRNAGGTSFTCART